jgi:hypothetical protein
MTDLEKFIKLYTSWGIELEVTLVDGLNNYQVYAKRNDKYIEGCGYTFWSFDKDEKFLYQECDS